MKLRKKILSAVSILMIVIFIANICCVLQNRMAERKAGSPPLRAEIFARIYSSFLSKPQRRRWLKRLSAMIAEPYWLNKSGIKSKRMTCLAPSKTKKGR